MDLSWWYAYFCIVWNCNMIMGGEVETIVRDFQSVYDIDFITIILENKTMKSKEFTHLHKSTNIRILSMKQMEFEWKGKTNILQDNCGSSYM